MSASGLKQPAPAPHGAAEEILDIEVIRDEHYKQNTVYCSWQEIISNKTPDDSALQLPGSMLPLPRR